MGIPRLSCLLMPGALRSSRTSSTSRGLTCWCRTIDYLHHDWRAYTVDVMMCWGISRVPLRPLCQVLRSMHPPTVSIQYILRAVFGCGRCTLHVLMLVWPCGALFPGSMYGSLPMDVWLFVGTLRSNPRIRVWFTRHGSLLCRGGPTC